MESTFSKKALNALTEPITSTNRCGQASAMTTARFREDWCSDRAIPTVSSSAGAAPLMSKALRTLGNRRNAGFGSFELLWALFLVGAATALVYVGSRLAGAPLGAGASLALGVGALTVGFVALGIVVAIAERRDGAKPVPDAQDDAFENGIASAPVASSQPKERDRCRRVLEDTEGKRRVRILQRDTGATPSRRSTSARGPSSKAGSRRPMCMSASTIARRPRFARRVRTSHGSRASRPRNKRTARDSSTRAPELHLSAVGVLPSPRTLCCSTLLPAMLSERSTRILRPLL